MIGLKKLNAYRDYCYNTAWECGWWHDPVTNTIKQRNKGELLCLVHSEISEAAEADEHDLMDDKLPSRKGIEVELADAMVRILDYTGGFNYHFREWPYYVDMNPLYVWANLHGAVSDIMESERKSKKDVSDKILHFVSLVCSLADDDGLDLWGALEEKVEFNKTREDHKPENRAKASGKKF